MLSAPPAVSSRRTSLFSLPVVDSSVSSECVDAFGRRPRYLRLSVTARCNFRCLYCAPEADDPSRPDPNALTDSEILRLTRIMTSIGVRKVRFTGGEPLLRRGLPALMKQVGALPGVDEIALSTNAFLLAGHLDDLADAGLTSVNISCDTMREDRFAQITRRRGVARILDAIERALRHTAIARVKINVVVMRGINDDEIPAFIEWCANPKIDVRFIEFMPTAEVAYGREVLVPEAEIRARIGVPLTRIADTDPSAPATLWRLPDRPGRVGFISTMTHKFCSLCDRIRVTADGRVARCLFAEALLDLRGLLRSGDSDQEIRDALVSYWSGKPAGHRLDDPNFLGRPTMIAVGG